MLNTCNYSNHVTVMPIPCYSSWGGGEGIHILHKITAKKIHEHKTSEVSVKRKLFQIFNARREVKYGGEEVAPVRNGTYDTTVEREKYLITLHETDEIPAATTGNRASMTDSKDCCCFLVQTKDIHTPPPPPPPPLPHIPPAYFFLGFGRLLSTMRSHVTKDKMLIVKLKLNISSLEQYGEDGNTV